MPTRPRSLSLFTHSLAEELSVCLCLISTVDNQAKMLYTVCMINERILYSHLDYLFSAYNVLPDSLIDYFIPCFYSCTIAIA